MKNRKNKTTLGLLLLLLLVVSVSVGYATLSSTLNINGTSKVTAETWNVHFDNIHGKSTTGDCTDTGTGLAAAAISGTNNDLVSFAVSMKKPGDKYTFKVNVVNEGSLPANAVLTVTGLTGTAAEYLTWTVTGISTDSANPTTLAATSGSQEVTITVEFKPEIDELPTSEFTANLVAQVVATQQ